ncbi:MAG: hypothetical protein JWN84_1379 [Nocardioides sp.]|nr:hypothetical protein [Nocardioides sp.]
MHALWDVDAAALHSPALRERLAAAGATRVQVNVDDEPVAAAMRIPAGTTPIGAVVSVWVDSLDVAPAVTAALQPTAGSLAGWEVEERRPIDPPETWDGSRVDGLANIAVLRRPEDLSVEDWRHRWLVDHTPVAIATQGTFGYLQNVVVAPVTDLPDGVAPVAALVEELFPSAGITDIHAFYGSGGDDAELNDRITRLMTSVGRFGADRDLDLVPTSRYCYPL